MALDEGDRAIIRTIALEAAEHVATRAIADMRTQLTLHQAACPVGQRFNEVENKAKGGWAVVVAVSGVVSAVAALVVSWFKG